MVHMHAHAVRAHACSQTHTRKMGSTGSSPVHAVPAARGEGCGVRANLPGARTGTQPFSMTAGGRNSAMHALKERQDDGPIPPARWLAACISWCRPSCSNACQPCGSASPAVHHCAAASSFCPSTMPFGVASGRHAGCRLQTFQLVSAVDAAGPPPAVNVPAPRPQST
jgi:hypothetical protein